MITYLGASKGYGHQTIVTLCFWGSLVALLGVFRFPLGSHSRHVWHLLGQKVRLIVKIDIEILGCFAAQEAV